MVTCEVNKNYNKVLNVKNTKAAQQSTQYLNGSPLKSYSKGLQPPINARNCYGFSMSLPPSVG